MKEKRKSKTFYQPNFDNPRNDELEFPHLFCYAVRLSSVEKSQPMREAVDSHHSLQQSPCVVVLPTDRDLLGQFLKPDGIGGLVHALFTWTTFFDKWFLCIIEVNWGQQERLRWL